MRVFLLNPPSDEPIRTPLLSLAYLAAALRRAGHEVGLLDASASHAPCSDQAILSAIDGFAPDLVGLHAKTLSAQNTWRVAGLLRRHGGRELKVVAGGPHVTVVPDEAFAHDCDFAIVGEGEPTLVALADALEARRAPGQVPGLGVADGRGGGIWGPSRGLLDDLDGLASPVDALDLFEPAWYGSRTPVAFGGVLSSRGCPAACTFCCNVVTGRKFRYRSPQAVADEIGQLRDHWGLRALTFLDDSFAVGRRRVFDLADALMPLGPLPWSCTAHPSHLEPEVLDAMVRAGCGGIDIGMESGDPQRLRQIGKGVTVERTLQVVRWCRARGLHVVVNLMFGWPGETEAELQTTRTFMLAVAEAGAWLNARGVLVPFPGTLEYDACHRDHGFTEWWLREPPLRYAPFPMAWQTDEVKRAYADDAALERNFFRHSDGHLCIIRELLALKAELTFSQVLQPPGAGAVPAAGAR